MANTGFSLADILGYVSLAKAVEEVRTGIPSVLPAEFEEMTEDVIADSARYISVKGSRVTSRIVQYGAPAYNRAQRDIGDRTVKCLHTYEQLTLKPQILQALRNYDNYDMQRLGMQEVARQTKQFATNFTNLRRASTSLVLANGVLYTDGNGNLLPSSSGAVETISMQVPAGNQGTCGGIFGASGLGSWAVQTTNIPDQLRQLKQSAAQATGRPVKHAFYGEKVPDYLLQNDYIENYLARKNQSNYYTEEGELPDLLGIKWHPVYEQFFEDSGGTNRVIFPQNQVTFTPEIDSEWWTMFQGSYMIPTSINIVADAEAAMANMKQIFGAAMYAQVLHNPVTVALFHVDTFLPVVKSPTSIWQADTVT